MYPLAWNLAHSKVSVSKELRGIMITIYHLIYSFKNFIRQVLLSLPFSGEKTECHRSQVVEPRQWFVGFRIRWQAEVSVTSEKACCINQ